MMMDASGMNELFREYQEGKIDQEEFFEKIMESVLDHVKSQYHDSLN
jgi:methionine synthase II (cobalamin-independent)